MNITIKISLLATLVVASGCATKEQYENAARYRFQSNECTYNSCADLARSDHPTISEFKDMASTDQELSFGDLDRLFEFSISRECITAYNRYHMEVKGISNSYGKTEIRKHYNELRYTCYKAFRAETLLLD